MSSPDVLIAGGGIIGCSIAWRLAQQGCRVTIADAGRLGKQASWAGAGMLAPGGEVVRDSPWASRSVASLRMYPDFVRELTEETSVGIDYRSCGALDLAYSEAELAEMSRKSADQAQLGIASVPVSSSEAEALSPGLSIDQLAGARYYLGDAIVDPRQILAALEKALRARGVEIRESCTIESLDPLRTTVLAAGAWSSRLLPGARESFPVKGHLAGYDLRPGSLPVILRHGHTYLLQRSNGFTVAGSTTERAGFDTKVDPEIVRRLHERARRYVPGLLRASPDSSWTGLRPGVEGDLPQVGRFGRTRIWMAYGHYRNGILLAPITAEIIAQEITASWETD